jgi:predicted nucleic acid-binding protein
MTIVLDTFVAGCSAKVPGRTPTVSDSCRDWIDQCEAAGHTIFVPAVVYYEALREMEQRRAHSQITRLKEFCLEPLRFIPLTTKELELAASLWGTARRAGRPTAGPESLDSDVILAAQVLSLNLDSTEYVVATTNVGHLSQFVNADHWTNITP